MSLRNVGRILPNKTVSQNLKSLTRKLKIYKYDHVHNFTLLDGCKGHTNGKAVQYKS